MESDLTTPEFMALLKETKEKIATAKAAAPPPLPARRKSLFKALPEPWSDKDLAAIAARKRWEQEQDVAILELQLKAEELRAKIADARAKAAVSDERAELYALGRSNLETANGKRPHEQV